MRVGILKLQVKAFSEPGHYHLIQVTEPHLKLTTHKFYKIIRRN